MPLSGAASPLFEPDVLAITVESALAARDIPGGTKTWDWIKKGAPVRIEIGPRDLASGTAALARRDRPHKEKAFVPVAALPAQIPGILREIQDGLFAKAKAFRDAHVRPIETRDDFIAYFTPENPEKPEIHGGFALAHWDGTAETEAEIKDALKVTVRCIPDGAPEEDGLCVWSGRPSRRRVLFAKSY